MLTTQLSAQVVVFDLFDVEAGKTEVGVVHPAGARVAVQEPSANVIGV